MPSDQVKNTGPGIHYLRLVYGKPMEDRLEEGFEGLLDQEYGEIPAEVFMEMCRRTAKRVRVARYVALGDFEEERQKIAAAAAEQSSKEKLLRRKKCPCGGLGFVPFYIYLPGTGRAYKKFSPCKSCNPIPVQERQERSKVIVLTEKEYHLHQRLDRERVVKGTDLPVRLHELRPPDTPAQKAQQGRKRPRGKGEKTSPSENVATAARDRKTRKPSRKGRRTPASQKGTTHRSGGRRPGV